MPALRIDSAALRGLLHPAAIGHALHPQLASANRLDRLDDVETEARRVRAELGHPPLVTPIIEIVATQAVYNVCDGDRYATVSQEVKDYCLGLYGSPPYPDRPRGAPARQRARGADHVPPRRPPRAGAAGAASRARARGREEPRRRHRGELRAVPRGDAGAAPRRGGRRSASATSRPSRAAGAGGGGAPVTRPMRSPSPRPARAAPSTSAS